MTVAELIAHLQTLPPDSEVWAPNLASGDYGEVTPDTAWEPGGVGPKVVYIKGEDIE